MTLSNPESLPTPDIANLLAAIAERAATEQALDAQRASELTEVEDHFQQLIAGRKDVYQRESASAQREFESLVQQADADAEAARASIQREFDDALRHIQNQYHDATSAAEQQFKQVQWEATAVFDATEQRVKQELDGLKKKRSKVQQDIAAALEELQDIVAAGIDGLTSRRVWKGTPDVAPPADIATDQPALAQLQELIDQASDQVDEIRGQLTAEVFSGFRPILLFVVCWAAAVLPSRGIMGLEWSDPRWILFSGCLAVVLTVAIMSLLYSYARKQTIAAFTSLREIELKADAIHEKAVASLESQVRQRNESVQQSYSESITGRNVDTSKAESVHRQQIETVERQRDCALQEANATFPKRLQEVSESHTQQRRDLDDKYPPLLADLSRQFEVEMGELEEQRVRRRSELKERQSQQQLAMADRWHSALREFEANVEEIKDACRHRFPPFSELAENGWTPDVEVPTAVPAGRYRLDLAELDGGAPTDLQLAPRITQFDFPMLLPFPDSVSMLVQADSTERATASQFLQRVMLRLLVSLPPGRIRFTVIDPVGLGESFSGFMHLADFDELLISSRIWTESNHIEQRLAGLTEHMENVFQKYLRNEFASIEEYNQQAGEVAEPYHFLVVANFPTNFTESAARRLISVVSSGPRCGVYTLMSVDPKQQLPFNFNLDDVKAHVTSLRCARGRLLCNHPELGDMELHAEDPPTPQQLRTIVRNVGHHSKGARHIEVAFQRIAPEEDQLWAGNSSKGIDVALGRAGATKLQHLWLGTGTSQHVLIAGKTGSGKSTLLHVMITNLALHYSPTEVEFYLVDFKKGVEFKTYATHRLPHARVIAIESDREFGVSVLQRLDEIMHERGDEFRRVGVQDVASYRAATPDATMPRIVLLIDEFQEFFVEDDRVAQSAALLLDRLVRQGRAFGMHVVLGSQTLSGAYSLARSTLGQIAVRIALECSDTDAHVILSEENTAARRLTRPGEAIYNDANGTLEGNNPFQVAWLADELREQQLTRLQKLATDRALSLPAPVVFEGNAAADVADNELLDQRLDSEQRMSRFTPASAWLGSAVGISDPVSITFKRQSGANLLIVGRDADAARGVLAVGIVCLSAEHAIKPSANKGTAADFVVFDGAGSTDYWTQLFDAIPHSLRMAGPKNADEVIADLAAELARRQAEDDDGEHAVYVVIHNLTRFQNLRRREDDFGFGSSDAEKDASGDKQLVALLRDGPTYGIHVLVSCDTYGNVDRWLPRRAISDFEIRVAFQMSSTDSSQLVDSPAANRLGPYRALLYVQERGGCEKFRPYQPPTSEWMAANKERLWRGVDFFLS